MNKKIENPIKLRGHHIAKLAINYWEKIFPNKSKFPNKNVDFKMEYMILERGSHMYYNEEQKTRMKTIYKKLIENPEIKIQIIGGLDSICLPDCSLADKDCLSKDGIDSFCLKEYDLKENQLYDARTIMNKIRDYPELNGYKWETPGINIHTFPIN
jgi:hypothetical protein